MLPPSKLQPWLKETGSLTLKAQRTCEHVEVKVLSEQWHKTLFVRQILMMCNEEPWWYARTIIPKQTFSKRAATLQNLSNRPLGSILFTDPNIQNIQRNIITQLSSEFEQNIVYPKAWRLGKKQWLWGRASSYSIDNTLLYMNEIFLPWMDKYL